MSCLALSLKYTGSDIATSVSFLALSSLMLYFCDASGHEEYGSRDTCHQRLADAVNFAPSFRDPESRSCHQQALFFDETLPKYTFVVVTEVFENRRSREYSKLAPPHSEHHLVGCAYMSRQTQIVVALRHRLSPEKLIAQVQML